MKKILTIALVTVCIFCFGFFWYQSTQAAFIYMEYELPDTINGGEPVPIIRDISDYELVEKWVNEQPSEHTGWSAVLFYYDNTRTSVYDGKATHWHYVDDHSTDDGAPGKQYPVSMFKDKIIAEHGQELYDKLESGGFWFTAISGLSPEKYREYPGVDTRDDNDNPQNGDPGFLYYENKVKVYLEYYDTGNEPTLTVLPPSQTIEVGETAQYQAIYRDANGVETDVTEQANWSPVDTTIGESLGNGNFKGKKIGSTDVQATYEGLTGKAVLNVGMEEPEPEPLPPNQPPVAIIDGPTEVEIGENFCLRSNSYDTDGYIVYHDWGYWGEYEDEEDEFTETSESACGLYYEDVGEQTVVLDVTDDRGAQDGTEHHITVTYPVPSAEFSVAGYLIENRQVWLAPERPYGRNNYAEKKFPIVENKWIIEALDENNQSSIIVIEDDLNNSAFDENIELLFREKGEYKVTHYVRNNMGMTDTKVETVVIDEDIEPTATLEVTDTVYLKANGQETVTFYSNSESSDDTLMYFIWEIAHDSDNDGSFDDETWSTLKKGYFIDYNYKVTQLGDYKVRFTALETFDEPTYESQVNLSDDLAATHRKYTQVEKTFKVDNMAPVVSLSAVEEKEVEIIFNMGDVEANGKYTKGKLQTRINNNLLPVLAAEGINADIRVEEPVYYEDGNKMLGTIERLSGDYDRDDGWEYYNRTLADDLFYDINLFEQTITSSAVSGIPSGGAYDTKGNYYYTNEPTMEDFDEDTTAAPENVFGINKYDAETGQLIENFVAPNNLFDHLDVYINKGCRTYGSSYPRTECWQQLYDDRYTEWDTETRYNPETGRNEPYEYREEIYRMGDINLTLYTSEEDNLYAVYKYSRDNGRDGYDTKEYHFIFLKYSPTGELIDKGELWSDHGENIVILTEDYLVTKSKYDRDGDGEEEMRAYLMSNIMGGPNYSLPPKWSGPPFVDRMRAREYDVRYYDSLIKDGNLLVLYGGSGGDDADDGGDLYLKTFTPEGETSLISLMNDDTVNIPVTVVDRGDTRTRYGVIYNFGESFLTRDGKIHTVLNYTFSTSSDYDRGSLGSRIFITDGKPGYAPPLPGYENDVLVDIYAETILPVYDSERGFDIAEPTTYLPTADIQHVRLLDGSYRVDNKRDFQILSENPPVLIDVVPNSGPVTPPAEIVTPGNNGERYRYSSFKIVEGNKPVTRGDKKTLADTLADTEWKSETSTKYYVTLSDQDINDLPSETEEVASLLDQDDIRFISIDTTSTKPLAQQITSAIEQDSLQVTMAYNDTNMSNAMTNMADFIIGDLFPPEDPTIDIHLGVDDSQYSLATVQSAISNTLQKRLHDAGYTDISITAASLTNKSINGQNVRKFNTSKKNEYYVLFKDSALTSSNVNHMVGDLLLQNAYFIGIGKTAAKTQFETAISKNMYRGKTFIEPTDITSAMDQLATYLIDTIREREGESLIYSTTDVNKVLYQASYWDFENNPKFKELYKTTHDPTVFENQQGKVTFAEGTLPEVFSKVGLYKPTYQAQDNPLVNYNATKASQFANYRKWSNVAEKVKVYIHRLPVPDFKVSVNIDTNRYLITNTAYDLDKQSINIGIGGGIAKQSFQWRKKGENLWKDGLPPQPLAEAVYEVKNEVMDFQNQTNYMIKELYAIPIQLPPVAQFVPDQQEIGVGETVNFINSSYEPTDQNMTARWYYKKSTQNESSYVQFATGAFTNGVGNAGWNPSTNALTSLETYDIKLVVTDSDGLSDEAVQQVIVTNTPPVACMNIPTPNYIGDTIFISSCASDPDGDPLSYTYVVTKPNGERFTYNTGHAAIDGIGNLSILANQHPIDLGTWTVLQTVSDGTDEASVSGKFIVLDQTVQGKVAHTEQWLRNIQNYNFEFPSKVFNLDESRGLLEFFKGEKFMLQAEETELATEIAVQIQEYPTFGVAYLREGTTDSWSGSLWQEDMFYTFADGEILTFEFVAVFENGWIARDEVKVKIRDEQYWTQHTAY